MGLTKSYDGIGVLESTIKKLDKEFGDKSVFVMGDSSTIDISVVSSGSLSLDMALGIGGFPKGRIIEIFGPESSGKTTLCLQAIREVQKNGGKAVFIDAECAFDSKYAENLNIDMKNLLISQPSYGEEALRIAEELIKTGGIDIVVIDSVAALIPKAELEGEIGDSRIGLQARMMSQALRKLTAIISKTGCICIFINQLREKVGVMFGSPETTTGGNALKFYSSIRIDIRRISSIKDDSEVIIGNRTRVKIVKNKLAPPFRTAEFDIIYGSGVDICGEVFDLSVEKGIISRNGSWFSYNNEKIGQGREAAISNIKNNKDLFDKLSKEIKK